MIPKFYGNRFTPPVPEAVDAALSFDPPAKTVEIAKRETKTKVRNLFTTNLL